MRIRIFRIAFFERGLRGIFGADPEGMLPLSDFTCKDRGFFIGREGGRDFSGSLSSSGGSVGFFKGFRLEGFSESGLGLFLQILGHSGGGIGDSLVEDRDFWDRFGIL